jgi:hypothetical protein
MKKLSTQTLAIAALSFMLVASVALSATGAWFTSEVNSQNVGTDVFGIIELNNTGTTGSVAESLDVNLDSELMPGDEMTIDFDIVNDSNAEMFLRLSLEMRSTEYDAALIVVSEGTAPQAELDAAAALIADFESANQAFIDAIALEMLNETTGQWVQQGEWIYFERALSGDEDVTDDNLGEDIDELFTYSLPTSITDAMQGVEVTFHFEVEAVQAANNGDETDPLEATGWPTA